MKVVYVLETNVASKQAVGVLHAYKDRGAELTFVSMLDRGDLHEAAEQAGIDTLALGIRSSRDWPAAARRLAAKIREVRPDVLHGVEQVPATLTAVAGRLAGQGLRVFHRQHSTAVWPQTLFARTANFGCQLLIACSEFAGKASLNEGVPPRKVVVVPNGVPAPRQVSAAEVAAIKRQLSLDPEALVLATVARLRPEKGIQVAIEALERIAATQDRPVAYVVAGSGPFEDELRALAAASLVPVSLVGHQADVAPWFAIADVVLMPSLFDAAPLAAAEAMAMAKPIVASATGGLLECIRDEVTGRLVEPGLPGPLAEATAGLLSDSSRRSNYGEAARTAFDQHYSVGRMAEGCLAAYERALSHR